MPAVADLPRRFSVAKPEDLRRDLERMSGALDRYTRDEDLRVSPRWQSQVVSTTALAFGRVLTVAAIELERVELALPRRTVADAGRECALIRSTTDGTIRVFAPGALVDGLGSYRLTNDMGFIRFYFDGANFWASRPGATDIGDGI